MLPLTPRELPFLAKVCWQTVDISSLTPQEMLRRYERGWHYRGVLGELLILFFSLSWVNAKEAPKPKPLLWQIDGIIAALDDGYPNVQGLALGKLGEYESQDLKSVLKKPEDIAHKAVILLKDKSVDSFVICHLIFGVY